MKVRRLKPVEARHAAGFDVEAGRRPYPGEVHPMVSFGDWRDSAACEVCQKVTHHHCRHLSVALVRPDSERGVRNELHAEMSRPVILWMNTVFVTSDPNSPGIKRHCARRHQGPVIIWRDRLHLRVRELQADGDQAQQTCEEPLIDGL